MTKKTPDGADNKAASKKDVSKKSSPTANDPWYGKVVSSTGTIVSGGAALLARTKAMGGQSKIIQNVAEATLKQADEAAKAVYVGTQKDGVIGFPSKKRKSK